MEAGVRSLWWDRELDNDGYRLREDVREAGHEIWTRASRKAESLTGDTFEAAEIMERAVLAVSQNLDRRNIPLRSQKTAALLMVAFGRELNRRAAKLRRIETAGTMSDLEALQHPSGVLADIEHTIDRSRFIDSLPTLSRRIWHLRDSGCDWAEIARATGMSSAKARTKFWRDLHRLRESLRLPSQARSVRTESHREFRRQINAKATGRTVAGTNIRAM